MTIGPIAASSAHLDDSLPAFAGTPSETSFKYHGAVTETDPDGPTSRPIPHPISTNLSRGSKSRRPISLPHPKPLPTPKRSIGALPQNTLPSAPASPPTPAPSPGPYQRQPSWTSASEMEDISIRDARTHFSVLNPSERQRYLAELLNLCDSQLLSFVHHFVSPRLKKDPFSYLPNELCLRVRKCSFSPGLC
jgi:F-box and WD-40 domain protein CDC4